MKLRLLYFFLLYLLPFIQFDTFTKEVASSICADLAPNQEYSNCNFNSVKISNANASGSKFKSVNFMMSEFTNVKFDDVEFSECSFFNSTFKNSSFDNSNFQKGSFVGSNLINTSFNNANFNVIIFSGSKQIDSSFKGITGQMNFFEESGSIEKAFANSTTNSENLQGSEKLPSVKGSTLQIQYDLSESSNIIKTSISKSSQFIALAFANGIIQIYKADSLKLLRQFSLVSEELLTYLEFSDDEKLLFSGNGSFIKVYDIKNGTILYNNQKGFTHFIVDKKNKVLSFLIDKYNYEVDFNKQEITNKKVIDDDSEKEEAEGVIYDLYTSKNNQNLKEDLRPSEVDSPNVKLQDSITSPDKNIIISKNRPNINEFSVYKKFGNSTSTKSYKKEYSYYIYNKNENIVRLNTSDIDLNKKTFLTKKNNNIQKILTPELSDIENYNWEVHKNTNYIKVGNHQWNLSNGLKRNTNWIPYSLLSYSEYDAKTGRMFFRDENKKDLGFIKIYEKLAITDGQISKFRKRQVVYSNFKWLQKTVIVNENYKKIGKEIVIPDIETINFVHINDTGNYVYICLSDGRVLKFDFMKGKLESESNRFPFNIISITSILDDEFLLFASEGGVSGIYNIAKNKMVAFLFQQISGEWAVVSPDGRYDQSPYFKGLHWVYGTEIIPIEYFRDTLFTPSLFESLLKNGPVDSSLESRLNLLPPKIKVSQEILVKNNQTSKCTVEINVTRGFSSITQASVENQTCIDNGLFNLVFDLELANDGLGEIRILNNGKKLDIPIIKKVSQTKVECKAEIPLEAGENILVIEASSKSKNFSRSREIELYYSSNKVAKKPTLYLLSIGINEYASSSINLNFGKPDSESFYEAMQGTNPNYETIEAKLLTNQQATKENILNTLLEFQKKIKEGDHLIFYYAGHGKTITNNSNEEVFYFLPTEITSITDKKIIQTNGISSEEIVRVLRAVKTSKQLIIIDACESGSVAKAFLQFNQEIGGHILYASGSKQLAKEFSSLGHGIFTYSLLESLKKYKSINISMLSGEMDLILEKLREKLNLYDQSFGYYRTQESPNFFIKDVK